MEISMQTKLDQVALVLNEMALLGSRFDELLESFQIYNKYKGNLDIELYECSLEMFESAIDAMEEQMERFHRMFLSLKAIVE